MEAHGLSEQIAVTAVVVRTSVYSSHRGESVNTLVHGLRSSGSVA